MSAKDAHLKKPSHASKLKSAPGLASEDANLNSISELLKDILFPVTGSGDSKCMCLQSICWHLTPPPRRTKGGKDGHHRSRRAKQSKTWIWFAGPSIVQFLRLFIFFLFLSWASLRLLNFTEINLLAKGSRFCFFLTGAKMCDKCGILEKTSCMTFKMCVNGFKPPDTYTGNGMQPSPSPLRCGAAACIPPGFNCSAV